MTQKQSPQQSELEQKLRQCVHDVRTPLGIISTGLEALILVRDDPEQFSAIYETIRREGVDALTQKVDKLVEVATKPAKPGTAHD